MTFHLESAFTPSGDQPTAIKTITDSLARDERFTTLLGVTGSGKTFTMANVIAETQRPTLIISHNKTLAAQLASEFREFFPKNAVSYFVSYYDYYQPEAYIARTDTYIEKETQINEEIDRLRHAATESLLSRRDVIIVASVSCIYGLGSPENYLRGSTVVKKDGELTREQLLLRLVDMQYDRDDIDFFRGRFRVRGDVVEVYPSSSEHTAYRFDFFGDDIDEISEFDALTGEVVNRYDEIRIFPATLYQAEDEQFEPALKAIRRDMEKEVAAMEAAGKMLEAHRLKQRVSYDLEMLENVGYTNGIENYSRYFDGRSLGEAPYTLMDYFPDDYLLIIDESHQTIPQIRGMYAGDKARKGMLVDHGFRLQAAYDNRPLQFAEFETKFKQSVLVSATPGPYEIEHSTTVAEQLIRPTGITEPGIDIRPVRGQVPDLLEEIKARVEKAERVLVTTLTKRMAEELADFINEQGISVQYLHSEVDNMERIEILRDLRTGKYDVLVGINLLREGLDLPEVSLVAILDADKEGFLRSETSLTQTMGRAARHIDGQVIMYADKITGSMQRAIDEVNRRREAQEAYNKKHGKTPQAIKKEIKDDRLAGKKLEDIESATPAEEIISGMRDEEYEHLVRDAQTRMQLAAESLDFERAAEIRDQLEQLQNMRPSDLFNKRRGSGGQPKKRGSRSRGRRKR